MKSSGGPIKRAGGVVIPISSWAEKISSSGRRVVVKVEVVGEDEEEEEMKLRRARETR